MNAIIQAQFNEKVREGYNTVPIFRKLNHVYDVGSIYETFCPDPEQGGVLESGRSGRYSYVAYTPIAEIRYENEKMEIEGMDHISLSADDDPLDCLRKVMEVWKAPLWPEGPDWQGGALGFL